MPRPDPPADTSGPMGPRVVTLGGGTGQSVLLAALRRIPARVTAVAGVTDDGGHSGELRRALHIPQVGDLRSCLQALAGDGTLARLVGLRFQPQALAGVQLGNLMLAGLLLRTGRLSRAAAEMSTLLGIREQVLPVSDDDAHLGAHLPGGRIVVGEWRIIETLRGKAGLPVRLFHRPPLRALPAVRAALREADWVLLAPGSLRTALASLLLARGIQPALAAGRSRIVFFVNLTTQPGNTDGFTARDHVTEIERYLPRPVDAIVVNRGGISAPRLAARARLGAAPVVDDLGDDPRAVRAALAERPGPVRLRSYVRARGRFAAGPHLVRHSAAALAKVLTRLFRRR